MSIDGRSLRLSTVKASLSEVVRDVRRSREPVIITVDGEPAVQLQPLPVEPRPLSQSERATERALMDALERIPRPSEAFDAVQLLADGRR